MPFLKYYQGLKQQWAPKVNTDCSTTLGRSTNTGSSLQQETTISSYVKKVYSLHQVGSLKKIILHSCKNKWLIGYIGMSNCIFLITADSSTWEHASNMSAECFD